ncbi:MAG: putative Ig domain-containing protein [Planctomycetes bacterium]|nr:putative Ig domain-containing protein [Planctomycetota bacterium]
MQSKLARRVREGLIAMTLVLAPGCFFEDIFSCSGSSSSGGGVVQPGLTYASTDMKLWATLTITPNVAKTKKPAQSFSVAPALPAGLSLDTAIGTISGAPESATPKATYVVTATFGPQDTATRAIDIEILPSTPPSALSYTPSSLQTFQFAPLPLLSPQVTGAIESYSCTPALPSGVQLDPDSGDVSGTWNGASGQFQFVVTATNPFGSTTTTLDFDVLPALGERALLVPSLGDQTLDLYLQDDGGLLPTDAEYLLGGRVLASVQSRDTRFVYASASNGHVYRMAYDATLNLLSSPVDLGAFGAVWQMVTSPDGQYLVCVSDLTVTRWSIQPDGSLCCPDTADGPFAPTAATMIDADHMVLASASPPTVWAYEVSSGLLQYGAPLALGIDDRVNAFANAPRGFRIDAVVQSYDSGSHTLSGKLSTFRLATALELATGGSGVRPMQTVAWGSQLTDIHLDTRNSPPSLLVSDVSNDEIGVFQTTTGQSIETSPDQLLILDGRPDQIHLSPSLRLFVLDSIAEEVREYDFSSVLSLEARTRTRRQPGALLPLVGSVEATARDVAFVTSAADSTVLALQTSVPAQGELGLASQGPLPTGAHPVDIVTSSGGPFVYTANRDGASFSAFRYDVAPASSLTPIETEQLPVGRLPNALAVTRGGGFLYFVDASVGVSNFAIDPLSGALEPGGGTTTVVGELSDAVVRIDALGRFAFVVQPTEGKVVTLGINLPTGFVLPTSTLASLSQPVDVWPSRDGRFAYVLDAASARLVRYTIDPIDGALVATGASYAAGTAPTRIVDATEPGQSGGDSFLVLDSETATLISFDVQPETGILTAGSDGVSTIPFGATAVQSIDVPGLGRGVLSTTDDGLSGQLHLLDWIAPNQLVEIDTAPIGRAVHALATGLRVL